MELEDLNPGYVIERLSRNERIRICNSHGSECGICGKIFKGEKCLRHEKGSLYLFWECFDCYRLGKIKSD